MNTIEIKLRFANEIAKWEERSVYTELHVIPGNYGYWVVLHNDQRLRLSEAVNQIAKKAGAVESRWNFKGLLQGHYSFVD